MNVIMHCPSERQMATILCQTVLITRALQHMKHLCTFLQKMRDVDFN